MNRTLRRPMFRMGGSTGEGITSGLDMPKTNASRQNFQNGNTDMESRYNRAMDFIQSKQQPRSSSINDFLISTGLNLVSRPTSGNIFADIATSSKEPFAQMQAAKTSRAADQDKLSQALVGDIMEQMSDEEIAKIKAKGEQGSAKQFEYRGKYEDYKKLLDGQRNLEARKRQLEEQNKTIKNQQTDEVISGGQFDEQIRIIDQQIEDNAKLQNLFQDKEEDAVRAAILKGISNGIFTFDDLVTYDETGVPPREDAAKGGRIGYQQGMSVQPDRMPIGPGPDLDPMPIGPGPDLEPMPIGPGPEPDNPVQDLTFEELRSRLPESITDDVIQLIANSQQALVEFANIQTQQDVKEFNRKYEVNLVLPQEA